MITAVFDALGYSKKLQAAGISEGATEVHAIALAEIIDVHLVTNEVMREAIGNLKIELKQDIEDLRIETRKEMVDMKKEMADLGYRIDKMTYQLTIRLGSMLAGSIFLLATLHKLVG